ncbi:MAG TPA: type IV pilin protein [Burkholderiaceae bacterium]|nr:type IV pilin protein [Burkholderiaceae bacterium]
MNTPNKAGPAEPAHKVKRQQAFTLIELMVTVAIVGIITAIAYPSYLKYIVRSNRALAQAHLINIAQREQQYLLDSRSYADKATLNLADPANVSSLYNITVVPASGTPPSFLAKAAPIPGKAQANANEPDLTIDQAGNKVPADKW